ncbi:MAG: Ig-like domain-containing protein, partial [Gammaproteobacteria bacterium]|nr:Ig-like domain-containing protein [Gammaproteobacteria bacterium]
MKNDRRIITTWISVLAVLAIGGCSSGSGSAPPARMQPPPDTTAPTVSAVAAPAAATVNRIVSLSVTASDNVGVTEVRFFVDGTLLGSDTSSPYEIDWDTGSAADGDHVLSAEAEDAAGNVSQSGDITVTVRNLVQFLVAATGEQEVTR